MPKTSTNNHPRNIVSRPYKREKQTTKLQVADLEKILSSLLKPPPKSMLLLLIPESQIEKTIREKTPEEVEYSLFYYLNISYQPDGTIINKQMQKQFSFLADVEGASYIIRQLDRYIEANLITIQARQYYYTPFNNKLELFNMSLRDLMRIPAKKGLPKK